MNALERFRLDGRIALVTGASGGLGEHFAGVLAAAGARVALCARRVATLEPIAARISSAGGTARALALDVTDGASVRACLDALASWGAPDIVVNNAGITVTRPLLEQSETDFDQVLATNVASILGKRLAGGVAPYAISKAAVVQATKAMALELARHRIRVNALLPGYVVTDLNRDFLESEAGQKLRSRIPTRRFGELTDLDGPLLLLASDAGAAMTGASVAVDSGHLVSSL
jgi:NAD(P)-dependent dehydrogenase (short-subunit alcohol dehydrogenase family)